MTIQDVMSQLEAWRANVFAETSAILGSARSQLITLQGKQGADDKMNKIEQLAQAKLEPIFIEQEMAFEPVKQACEQYFQTAVAASESDYAVQERVNNAVNELRDLHQRKVQSLIAQARAQELQASAGASPVTSPRFCKACGAAL